MVVAGLDMLRRFLHATGEERQQFKWFAYVAAWLPPISVLYVAFLYQTERSPLALLDLVIPLLLMSAAGAIGVAVLKYRLYEIDIIINRTLVYVPLTAILAGLYIASA
jgi:hypothetical protein